MTVLTLVLLLPAQVEPTEWTRQSRAFFEKHIDFKIENDLIVVQSDPEGGGGESIRHAASAAFPNVSRLRVRHRGGSSSSSRGGSGNVNIQFEASGESGHFEFKLQSPDGEESMVLRQQGPGQLSVEYRCGKSSTVYTQAKGKCSLKIRAGTDSLAVTRHNFRAVFQEDSLVIRKYLLKPLENYFDRMPVIHFAEAPPGKVILHLRDKARVVGALELSELKLHTDYGTLTLPRGEIRQLIFPGSGISEEAFQQGNTEGASDEDQEIVVVTKRFSPRGRLELDTLELITPYGDMHVETSEILTAVFGPPLEETKVTE